MSAIRGVGFGLLFLIPAIGAAQQTPASAGATSRPVATAARADEGIDINGHLDAARRHRSQPVEVTSSRPTQKSAVLDS